MLVADISTGTLPAMKACSSSRYRYRCRNTRVLTPLRLHPSTKYEYGDAGFVLSTPEQRSKVGRRDGKLQPRWVLATTYKNPHQPRHILIAPLSRSWPTVVLNSLLSVIACASGTFFCPNEIIIPRWCDIWWRWFVARTMRVWVGIWHLIGYILLSHGIWDTWSACI